MERGDFITKKTKSSIGFIENIITKSYGFNKRIS